MVLKSIILDIHTRDVFISKKNNFYEHVFPYIHSTTSNSVPCDKNTHSEDHDTNHDNASCGIINNAIGSVPSTMPSDNHLHNELVIHVHPDNSSIEST
jgi:hypothetical protein